MMMMIIHDGNFMSESKFPFKVKLYFWKQFIYKYVYNHTASWVNFGRYKDVYKNWKGTLSKLTEKVYIFCRK
jgi:hypothetical protein